MNFQIELPAPHVIVVPERGTFRALKGDYADFARYLRRRGHNVDIFSPDGATTAMQATNLAEFVDHSSQSTSHIVLVGVGNQGSAVLDVTTQAVGVSGVVFVASKLFPERHQEDSKDRERDIDKEAAMLGIPALTIAARRGDGLVPDGSSSILDTTHLAFPRRAYGHSDAIREVLSRGKGRRKIAQFINGLRGR